MGGHTHEYIFRNLQYKSVSESAGQKHRTRKKHVSVQLKKKRALKRQIFGIAFMFLTILVTVLVSTSCLKGNQVKASSVHEENVYYKTIQVEEGDTLWTLADQYMGNCSF